MIIELPYPPSVNTYWGKRVVRSKKTGQNIVMVYVCDKGTEYCRQVGLRLLAIRLKRTFKKLFGRLNVTIELYPPDKRERDIDNCMKGLLDSLQKAGVYENDSQIDLLLIKRCTKVEGGKVIVSIEERGDLLP